MEEVMQKAADHLAVNDPVLKPVIKRAGLCTIRPHKDYYWELVDAIISQQLSVKAAAKIEERFKNLFPGALPTPDQILVTEPEKLRAVGLSGAKVNYVKDLAQHIRGGKLELEKFDNLSNDEIITELTAVKGIGQWTAQMFLMFAMARLNILAVGDLGIRAGIQKLYDLPQLPAAEEIQEIAAKNNWSPYESVACWYIWHSR
jgi:DNA-3-methyladenine glycosylase II